MSGRVERVLRRPYVFVVVRRPLRALTRSLCGLMLIAVPTVAAPSSSIQSALSDEPSSSAAGLDHLADDQMLVRELMRAEAVKALSAMSDERLASRRAPQGRPLDPDLTPPSTARPVLKGIYGVGKRLLAEVQWQGHTYVYLNGRALPLGRVADPNGYLLQGIQSRCVQLARGDSRLTLCLDQDGAEKG